MDSENIVSECQASLVYIASIEDSWKLLFTPRFFYVEKYVFHRLVNDFKLIVFIAE